MSQRTLNGLVSILFSYGNSTSFSFFCMSVDTHSGNGVCEQMYCNSTKFCKHLKFVNFVSDLRFTKVKCLLVLSLSAVILIFC